MIIVSQNKKRIFNFENLVEIRVFTQGSYPLKDNVKGYDLQGVTQDGKYIILGIYDTEERAKEVLQEIISKYKTTLYNSKTNETVVNVPKVYEMPEK